MVGDATFGHLAVPWHLTTREYVTDIRRVLTPTGTWCPQRHRHPTVVTDPAELATVAAVFDHVALVAPVSAIAGRNSANFVVLGSDGPLPLDALRPRIAALTDPVRGLDHRTGRR